MADPGLNAMAGDADAAQEGGKGGRRRRKQKEAKWEKLDIRIEMEGSGHRERRNRRGRRSGLALNPKP